MKPGCTAHIIGDQYICDRCGVVWDINDPDPPECNKQVVWPTKVEGEFIDPVAELGEFMTPEEVIQQMKDKLRRTEL